MDFSLPILCLASLVALATRVECCDEPMGWETQPFLERAASADLVIIGTFHSIERQNNTPMYTDVLIHTTVECVLKNADNITLGATVTIMEEDPTYRCVSNLHAVEQGERNILFINREDPDENADTSADPVYQFDNINVQGAIEAYTEDTVDGLVALCGFQGPFPDTGTMCPTIPEGDCVESTDTSGASSVYIGFSLVLACIAYVAL